MRKSFLLSSVFPGSADICTGFQFDLRIRRNRAKTAAEGKVTEKVIWGVLPRQGGGRWRLRHVVLFVLLWMVLHRTAPVLGCGSINCYVVLTEAQGEFRSPCYPQKYPNSHTCKWTMQAPTGFIIQLSFLDFELEEAQDCMYDRVVVNTGSTESKFCGLTASGLTLNSTRNVMEVSFISDFSIQKRGFMVSFQHVAVALRNQKVKIPNGNGQIAEVINSVSIPALNELTVCFEVERTGSSQTEWLFTYYDSNNNVVLSFGYNQTGMEMVIDGVVCPVESIISVAEFTSSMKFFCVLWMSSNSRVAAYFDRRYYGKTCSPSSGHSVPAGGVFKLGGLHSFKGNMYNLRLWDRAMTVQELNSLTCDMVGNIIDWDNSQWTISSSLAQTDNTLSCMCYPHCIHLTAAAPTSGSNPATGCDSGGLGCSAASSPTTSSTDSTNTSHATNAISHAFLPPISSTSTSTPSIPLTPAISTNFSTSSSSSSSSSSAEQTTSITAAVSSASTNHADTNSTALVSSFASSPEPLPGTTLQLPFLTTNHPSTNKADVSSLVERSSAKYPNSPRPKHLAVDLHKTLAGGLTPGRNFGLFQTIRRTRRALSSNPRSLTSSQFSPTGQNSRPPKSQHQPRIVAPAPGPASPVDPSHSRPPAAFWGSAFYHSPKHSLGFISTPLRKRPSGGRRPAATRATPSRVEVRVTKPSPLKTGLRSTARPSSRNTSPMLGNQLNSLISTAKSSSSTHNSTTVKIPTTSRDSETLLAPIPSRASSPRQHKDGLFYRVSFTVESELNLQAVQRAAALWINQTFQNWTHSLDYISCFSGFQQNAALNSYTCQALLMITNESLGEADVLAQLINNPAGTSLLGQAAYINIHQIENCPEDNNLHYLWPETKPRVTHFLPCFPNKDQSASRTCLINTETFQSDWSTANLTNCSVTAENAAGVAEQLENFTRNSLSNEEVSQVVTKVQELVNVAKIDTAVAGSVVQIISNVMVSSEKASNIALKAVDELAQKVEFDGPSVNISSKNLALGVLALDSRLFNGTSFSAFFPPNSSDPMIGFDRTANPLAQVTLPASLLSGVSEDVFSRSSLSRINFMFFSSPSLFMKEQKGLSLNSYVVASSVGNLSITDLQDPVKIEISHLSDQASFRRECVFWDFSMNRGDGGWNNSGCSISKESTSSRSVCLCNHLTHFGILMDISQTSFIIDPENKKVLTFLSYIGCGISAICSAATLLTYIAFEKLRRDYPSKILMNLSTSLLFLNIVFLLDGWLASMVHSEGLCISAAVLLHYFLLTSFTWMGLESVHMYIALVKVFNTYIRRYILKFCIVGWGLPAVLVGIVVTVNKNFYGVLKDHTDESAMMCWIKEKSVFYSTCVGYFCLMFLLNVAMFIVVMMQICGRNGKRSNRTLREEILRNLRSVVSLTFLLGMTWGFALFAWGPVYLTFTYLFTIFNSLQGLFIFIFHCALKENVQKQWRRYLCCGPYRLSENSDWSKTATNNTKKVSSDNLAKSLSSSSFGSSTINWTSKAKATLTPFSKRNRNTDKCFPNQTSPKCVSSSSSSSDVEPNSSSSSSSSSILPVSQMIDKVRDYCSTRTDNFYKNIIMSDSFANCTRL
ncbi:adhesion G-protein coupled receptor G6 isoform X3 [Gambusia affinis]|uniref:adhesion G-protein coupled receptor G6 isoform X3 n=1 Tax=Gambusia affinis TaxID=33528 RepID=UPI001CDCD1E7|nr:adhesion G-protein coupled receptor G6 isoform X3 [Gambusia affinis]